MTQTFHRYTPSTFPSDTGNFRETEVEEKFLDALRSNSLPSPPVVHPNLSFNDLGLDKHSALLLLQSMFITRIAHNTSRRAGPRVFYTIGPGGHEAIAGLALAMRNSDPALLHYRDTAFLIMRSFLQDQSMDVSNVQTSVIRELMRSYAVSVNDIASGGRHKVLGNHKLNIIPTTSTIASHLPRAVTLAASISLAKQLEGIKPVYPHNSVVLGSAGDASINHATYRSAVNYLQFCDHLNYKVPSLMVVNDNDIGISVPTPEGWVKKSLISTGLPYFYANGTDVLDVYTASSQAVASARKGKPTFLHIKCPRLFNHAGSDAGQYQTPAQIKNYLSRDPLPATAWLLINQGIMSAAEIYNLYLDLRHKTESMLNEVSKEPKLEDFKEIAAAVVPPPTTMKKPQKFHMPSPKRKNKQLILKQHINMVLEETLAERSEVILFGQDIGIKGGNYGVTDGLFKKFGTFRVRDSFLDETSIIGSANGFALNGFIPIVEICYLAYIHNALDQVRGEAATLSFFSNGNYQNGMIIRLTGGGLTQFGGHFHNENSFAPLLDIPGIVLLYPSNGPDYAKLFRTCVDMAQQGRVVIIIESIKAYTLRSIGLDNTKLTAPYPDREEILDLDTILDYGHGRSLAIVTYGNGVHLALAAKQILEKKYPDLLSLPNGNGGITVVERPCIQGGNSDLHKWIARKNFHAVLFADECRLQGCPSSEIIASFVNAHDSNQPPLPPIGLVAAGNSFIPLGPGANAKGLYLSEETIIEKALELLKKEKITHLDGYNAKTPLTGKTETLQKKNQCSKTLA